MRCFRCGYCCTSLLAVIVVDPEIGIEPGNLRSINMLEEPCPHLRGDKPGEYSCIIHDKPWFSETPCAAYQSHNGSQPCRMGDFLINLGASTSRRSRSLGVTIERALQGDKW